MCRELSETMSVGCKKWPMGGVCKRTERGRDGACVTASNPVPLLTFILLHIPGQGLLLAYPRKLCFTIDHNGPSKDTTCPWPTLAKDGKPVRVLTNLYITQAVQRNFSESKNVCDHILLLNYSESLLNRGILVRSDTWSKSPSGSLAKDQDSPTKVSSIKFHCIFSKFTHTGPTCSYEALGLVASLNPTLSGGVEPTTSRHDRADTRSIELSSTPEVSDTRKTARTQSVPRGFGRIIRDENGNVMDVDLGEDAEDVEESNNQLIEDIPHPATQEGAAGWISLGSNRPSSSKSVVQCKLECCPVLHSVS